MKLLFLAAALVAAIAVVVVQGLWRLNGFSARTRPTEIERLMARAARRAALPRQARAAVNPVAFSDEAWAEARAHFADHCASCHANDGSGQTELGQGLYPKAPDMRLSDTQSLADGELYWVIENGIRFTGMPAWGDGTDHDLDTWKLVHFIRRLDRLTPGQLDEMASGNPRTPAEIKEELEDQQFLSGGDSPEPNPNAHHH